MFPIGGGGLRTAAALPSFHTARLAAAELGLAPVAEAPGDASAAAGVEEELLEAAAGERRERAALIYIAHGPGGKKKRRAPLAPRVRSVCFFPHECIAIDYCRLNDYAP